jgi:hypothetical protein
MTIFQLIYDASFYSNNISAPSSLVYQVTTILQIWGGISQALISNEIAFTVLYILLFRKAFNIFKKFCLLMSFANFPSILVCILYCIYLGTGYAGLSDYTLLSYFGIRLASILAVFLIYVYTAWLVSKMKSQDSTIATQEQAIKILVSRLKYYPLVVRNGGILSQHHFSLVKYQANTYISASNIEAWLFMVWNRRVCYFIVISRVKRKPLLLVILILLLLYY